MTEKTQAEKIPLDYQWISQKIYYNEKDTPQFRTLLDQAFTRRSYTNETGGAHNETLEFIGDAVLELIVTKYLANTYIKDDNYTHTSDSKINEGALSQLREKLIKNKYLATRIDELNLYRYLTMGSCDLNTEHTPDDLTKIKADLFEAIIGALTLNADWDLTRIEPSVHCMLDIENYTNITDDNYTQLFQEWYQKYTQQIPEYTYKEHENGITCTISFHIEQPGNFEITMKKTARGYSKKNARANLAKDIWKILDEEGFTDPILDDYTPRSITCENAINKLQELYQKGYCTKPDYIQPAKADITEDGKLKWKCVCTIQDLTKGKYRYSQFERKNPLFLHYTYTNPEDRDTIIKTATSTSKINAKKYAAYAILQTYFGWDKRNKTEETPIRKMHWQG